MNIPLIAHNASKHTLFFWLFCLQFGLLACQTQTQPIDLNHFKKTQLDLPSGQQISVEVVYSDKEQTRGLSGRASSQFKHDQAMLFYYTADGVRSFWMPDTYFDLDIFFLDANLKVLDIERNVPRHPGRDETLQRIYRTRHIYCRHVLEMRADSPLAKSIKIGTQLSLPKDLSLQQIQSNIHQLK